MFQTTTPEAAAPAAPAAEAVQPSLAEQLSRFVGDAWSHLARLDPGEALLNLLVSAAVIVGALAVIWLLRRLFDSWVRRFADSDHVDVPEGERHTPRAVGVTWGLLRLLILGAALLMVIGVWGIDPLAWLSADVGARLVRLALILVLVTAVVEVAGFVTRRFVEGFAARSRDARRASQIRSLGPLLTGSIQGVLVVIGLLTLLSEVGVKVGPLLASAGVVGIAVGFGAQSLVKDFLTGVFLIVEDAVSIGDNVRIGDSSGTVEGMTLRTLRLRNMNGTLHIIPYSEAQVIHNRTKLLSSYVFDLQVAYDADIDLALQVMTDVGEEMRADPVFGAMITQPFDILGVDRLADSGVVLKARVTTTPKDQWKVGREYNRRIKLAFDRAGVEIPFPTLQLVAPKGPLRLAGEPPPDVDEARETRSRS
jgi:small conductance mechanosensitive channel